MPGRSIHIPNVKYFIVITALLFSLNKNNFSQTISNFQINHLTSENLVLEHGLSQNSIHCILQDSKGYMWFGTWDGLNKFDGYNYTIYRVNYSEPEKGLSNSNISAIYEDKNGDIWIGTERGLNKLIRSNNTFQYFKNIKNKSGTISNDSILSVNGDEEGNIWIGTQWGLNKYDPKTKKFHQYISDPNNIKGLSDNAINCILPDNNHIIWIGTVNGLNKLNVKTGKFTHYFHKNDDSTSISNNLIWDIFKDSDGNLWIATDNGLNYLNRSTEKFTRYLHSDEDYNSLSDNRVRTVLQDKYGMIWVGTLGGGLNLLDRKTNIFYHFNHVINDPNSLSNDNVMDLYQDEAGIIWVGTQWKGVNKIDRSLNKFNHYYCNADDETSLNSNLIWALHEDKSGLLWIGTMEGGINILDKETGIFTFIRSDSENENSLCSDKIKYIYQDRDGIFWIGTFDKGMDRYDKEKNLFTHFEFNPANLNSLSGNRINYITQDRFGAIWISTNKGLNKYDLKTKQFTVFKHIPSNPNSLVNDRVNCIFEDSKGTLWICTYNGLSMYIRSKNKFKNFRYNPDNKKGISAKGIFSIYEDKLGNYWLATMGGGLDKFDPLTGECTVYNESDGLSDNLVYNILEDNNGNLWLTTNFGLSKFNIKDKTFINFDANDGIQGHEFNFSAAFKNKKGQMFFGGMNGLNFFIPDQIKKNNHKPSIVITDFKVFHESYSKEYSDGDTIELSYHDNFFSFEFSALDYSIPSKNKYEYKLEDVDINWKSTNANRRFAEYTKVSPGTYIFKVKGSNNDGVWNEEYISVTVIIHPPWWQSWAFRIPMGLFIIGIIWYMIYLRMRKIRKKHEMDKKVLDFKKQLFEIEQKALRLQMNPHFIFNSLNSIQSFILTRDTDKAINYLAKFAQLMRLILSNSREQYVSVEEELRALTYYLEIEKLRFDNKFDFFIKVDMKIDQEFTAIPPMLMQPYVENAILHGILNKPSKGKIEIELKIKENSIICSIEDDGVGREKAKQISENSGINRKSKGMMITKERLDMLNNQGDEEFSVNIIDLISKDGIPLGTRVEIKVLYKVL